MTTGLGLVLLAWREREGLSRLAAARRLGVAHTTLRSWELRGVCPQPLQLRALVTVIGGDVERLRALAGPDRVRTARTSGGEDAAPLCRARLAAGLTMTQLARKLGVVPSTVSRWENGVRTPPAHLRPRLAAALRMAPAELDLALPASSLPASSGVLLPGLGRLRRERGLTQEAFRTNLGIGSRTAGDWERGRVMVPSVRVAAVASALDLDEATLLALGARPAPGSPGERGLVALRRAAGMSQPELAHHVGVSVRTVKHWESGSRPVPLRAARRIARCLHRPLATVLSAAGLTLPPVPSPDRWADVGLPEVLTALRRSSGWSAAAVGRQVGVSGPTVRGWERGSVRPSVSAALRLERVHGLPPGGLVRLVAGLGADVPARRAG